MVVMKEPNICQNIWDLVVVMIKGPDIYASINMGFSGYYGKRDLIFFS